MNKENYTSLELSKWLKENGCELEYTFGWSEDNLMEIPLNLQKLKLKTVYPAYDILNDLCVRYAKEMFGEKGVRSKTGLAQIPEKYYKIYPTYILLLLQQNKKQEAEDYIKNHCLFNSKNHE
jgi:hypothetical protein